MEHIFIEDMRKFLEERLKNWISSVLRSVIRFLLCSIECKMTEKKEGKQVEQQRYTVQVGKVLRQYEAGHL